MQRTSLVNWLLGDSTNRANRRRNVRRPRHYSLNHPFYLGLESLETRRLLSVTWTGGGDGTSWSDKNNWGGTLPGASDDVIIPAAFAGITVNHSTGTDSIKSLLSASSLNLSGGTLTVGTTLVPGSVEVDNTFTLSGGTLADADIKPGSGGQGLTLTQSGGTLDGVTADANLDLTQNFDVNVNIKNGLTLNGTATLGSASGHYGLLLFVNGTSSSQTLGGSGSVDFVGSSNQLYVNTASETLTIGPSLTIHGQSGTVDGVAPSTIINQGKIDADTAPGLIQIQPSGGTFTNQGTAEADTGGTLQLLQNSGTWSNTGTLKLNGGTLDLGGNFTTAGIGTLNRSGGTLNITGTLDNTVATLTLDAASGAWQLFGGTIKNGTYSGTSPNDLVLTGNGGTLDGLTAGDIDATQYFDANATVKNGLTLNGTATLGSAGGHYGLLLFVNGTSSSQTLGGSGSVDFVGGSNQLYVNTASETLTIGSSLTIHGGSGTVDGVAPSTIINQGKIDADTANGLIQIQPSGGTFTNQGTAEADTGGTLQLLQNTGTWSNAGTLKLNGGTLDLGGNFTTAGIGTLNRSGGTLNITGTLDNTMATLTLDAASGAWQLFGGTIKNGTYTGTSPNDLVLTGNGGTLDGLTAGDIDGTQYFDANATVKNGLTLNGTATLGSASGHYGLLLFVNGTSSSQTLGGSGSVVFVGGSNQLYVNTASETLTIGSSLTIHGGSGTVDGIAPSTIINQGKIDADTAAGLILIQPSGGTFTNQGTAEADTGGTLQLLQTSGTWSNTGTLKLNGGTLNLGGNFTTAGIGIATFSRTGGTLNITGTLDNTGNTLALDAVTGPWQLLGGTIKNGTYTSVGSNDLVITQSGGTLDGLIADGDLDLTQNFDVNVNIKNGLTLNGTATLGSASGHYGLLYFVDGTSSSQTLGGSGSVDFVGSSNQLYVNTASETLTIGSSLTIHGGSGTVDGIAPSTIINQGKIDADTAAGLIRIQPSGGTFTNQGTAEADTGGTLQLLLTSGTWSNTGTLKINGGTLDLGGNFTTAGIGISNFNRSGGTLNITGNLDNTGNTLVLNAVTGPWQLLGGTIKNGSYTSVGSNDLVMTQSGGTLDGLIANGDLDLTQDFDANATVKNGLTLNGTATLGSASGHYGLLYFVNGSSSSQTLGGSGSVDFVGSSNQLYVNTASETLTIGPSLTIHGQSGDIDGQSTTTIVNQGTIDADTSNGTIQIQPSGGTFTNQGTADATGGGTLTIDSPLFSITGSKGAIASSPGSTISISHNLLGDTTDVTDFLPQGNTLFNGAGTVAAPQLMEAMSNDLGAVAAGFTANFDYGSLALANNTYLKLVDQSHNSAGVGNEAVYTNSLTVPLGTTLDLNGLHLYVRTDTIAGTVVGGSISIEEPDVSITNDDGVTSVTAGTSTTYTIVVSNDPAANTATNVAVSDPLPANASSATWSGDGHTNTSGALSDTIASLAPGASVTYTMTVNVAAAATGSLVNTATVTEANNSSANTTATDTDSIGAQVNVGVANNDGVTSVAAGSSTTYTIVVTNNGGITATNVAVSDPLPANASSATWSGDGHTNVSGALSDTIASLAPGASVTYTMTVDVATSATGSLANSATVTVANNSSANTTDTDTDTIVPQVNVGVTTNDGVTSVAAGASTTYTIVVMNNGSNTATNVAVSDLLPANAASATWSGDGHTNVAGALSDTIASLAPGASVTYTMTVQVAAAATGSLVNTATVTVANNTSANATATDTDSIVAQVNVGITNDDGVTSVAAGASTTYTIVVTNNGSNAAANVAVSDPLPANAASATWSGDNHTNISGALSDTIASLAPGASVTYTMTVQVAAAATGSLVNTATVTAANNTSANATATDTDTIVAQVNVGITNDDGITSVATGASTTYTIVVTNHGAATTATNIAVSDPLPANAASATWSGDGHTNISGALSDTITSLAPGASVTYTMTVQVAAAATGSLVNTATVTAANNTSANPTATDTDTIVAQVDVGITNDDGVTSVAAGTSSTYTIVVTNNSGNTATNVAVSDSLPANASSATWSGDGHTNISGALSDTIASLAPGASVTYTMTVQVAAAATGSLMNTATVTAANNTSANATATDTDSIVAQVNVGITNDDGVTSVAAGASTTYTIVVTNNGGNTATTVAVSDPLPANAASATWSGDGHTNISGALSDTITSLAPGASVTYTMTVQVTAAATGSLVNTATVTAANNASANTTATDTDTIVAQVNVGVTNSDGVTSVAAGASTTYTIVVTNNGTNSATNIAVSDPLPAGASSATWSGDGHTNISGALSDTITSLAPGASVTYTMTVQVAAAATGSLVNTATVTTANNTSANATANDTDTIVAQVNVGVTNSDGVTSVAAGASTTYTIVVTNNGTNSATNIAVSDPLPANASSATWGGDGHTNISGTLSDTITSLAPGASVSYTMTVRVAAAATGSLVNTATVTTANNISANSTATDTDTIATSQPTTFGYLAGVPGDGTNETLVHNLYRELLGREPEAAGSAFWLALLQQNDNAAGRQAVVQGFLNSPEYKSNYVTTVYEVLLGRAPESKGLKFWTDTLGEPGTLGEHNGAADEKFVLSGIIGSDEFYARSGGSVQGFVNSLYKDLLGRTGESAGIDFWTALVQAEPTNRDGIVRLFLSSPEAEHDLLDTFYPAAGGTASNPLPAPGTGVASGAEDLAVITGDGWENLYLEGALGNSSQANDQFFTELAAGVPWDDVQLQLLATDQYYTDANRPHTL